MKQVFDACPECKTTATVNRKRKRKVSLVVQENNEAKAKSYKTGQLLLRELKKKDSKNSLTFSYNSYFAGSFATMKEWIE